MLSDVAGRQPVQARYLRRLGRGASDRELLQLWQAKREPQAREELVERYLPLARRLARRWRRLGESPDDLIQVASLALLKAIDRFDSERHTSLASYAVPTILGELKRWFRDRGWAVHVPRDLQDLALRVDRAAGQIARETGRSPSSRELADRLSLSVESVIEAQEAASAYRALPLEHPPEPDAEGGERARSDSSLCGEDPGFEVAEQRALIGGLIGELSSREREVLRLRFAEDLTQSEIGERIGVSQMHVSRIIRSALSRLQDAAAGAHP